MWGTFRVRLLIVIVITTLVSLGMQMNNNTREVITPILSFMLKDYNVEKKAALLWENLGIEPMAPIVPVMTETFSPPCETYEIDKGYGWYWNQDTKKQEFLPGVQLAVPNNSLVKAVMEGTVSELGSEDGGRTILVEHANGLYSYYAGLKEVLVDEKAKVNQGEVLGKCSPALYFELRGEDGPVNPLSIFNPLKNFNNDDSIKETSLSSGFKDLA